MAQMFCLKSYTFARIHAEAIIDVFKDAVKVLSHGSETLVMACQGIHVKQCVVLCQQKVAPNGGHLTCGVTRPKQLREPGGWQERALLALLGPTILAEVEKLVEEQHAALPTAPSGERRRFETQVNTS